MPCPKRCPNGTTCDKAAGQCVAKTNVVKPAKAKPAKAKPAKAKPAKAKPAKAKPAKAKPAKAKPANSAKAANSAKPANLPKQPVNIINVNDIETLETKLKKLEASSQNLGKKAVKKILTQYPESKNHIDMGELEQKLNDLSDPARKPGAVKWFTRFGKDKYILAALTEYKTMLLLALLAFAAIDRFTGSTVSGYLFSLAGYAFALRGKAWYDATVAYLGGNPATRMFAEKIGWIGAKVHNLFVTQETVAKIVNNKVREINDPFLKGMAGMIRNMNTNKLSLYDRHVRGKMSQGQIIKKVYTYIKEHAILCGPSRDDGMTMLDMLIDVEKAFLHKDAAPKIIDDVAHNIARIEQLKNSTCPKLG